MAICCGEEEALVGVVERSGIVESVSGVVCRTDLKGIERYYHYTGPGCGQKFNHSGWARQERPGSSLAKA